MYSLFNYSTSSPVYAASVVWLIEVMNWKRYERKRS